MFYFDTTTTKIKWFTIALMLLVILGGSFNPTLALADEGEAVAPIIKETPAELLVESVETVESVVVENPDDVIKDSEIIKDIDQNIPATGVETEPELFENEPVDNSNEVTTESEVVTGAEEEDIVEGGNIGEESTTSSETDSGAVESIVEGVSVVEGNDGEVLTPLTASNLSTPSSDESTDIIILDNHDIGVEDVSVEYSDLTLTDNSGPIVEEEISNEYSQGFVSDIGQEDISNQYSFNTVNNDPNPIFDEEISLEYSFITLSDIGQDEAISLEYSFITDDGGNGGNFDEEISLEYSFITLSDIGQEEVSNEYSFTTNDNGGGPDLEEEISLEYSFRTEFNIGQEEVSSEYNFTTGSDGGNGGGGGGGGRHRDRDRDDEVLPTKCLPLILEYIRFGRDNNPFEVLKLQWFLRTFENLDVPLSGYYDRTTYEAVRIFQTRHADPILTSWGISEPTGFVFISTSLNINYIYCDIDGAQFDLRNFYKTTDPTYISMPKKGDGAEYLLLPPPIQNTIGDEYMLLDVDLPEEIAIKYEGFLQTAMIGVLNFFSNIGIYFKELGANLFDWFEKVKTGNTIELVSNIKWWGWLLLAGFLMVIIGLVLLLKRLNDLKVENSLLEESNQEMVEAKIELDDLESIVEDETLEKLVEEYNEHMTPEDVVNGHLEHISETLKDRVIELEGDISDIKKEDQ